MEDFKECNFPSTLLPNKQLVEKKSSKVILYCSHFPPPHLLLKKNLLHSLIFFGTFLMECGLAMVVQEFCHESFLSSPCITLCNERIPRNRNLSAVIDAYQTGSGVKGSFCTELPHPCNHQGKKSTKRENLPEVEQFFSTHVRHIQPNYNPQCKYFGLFLIFQNIRFNTLIRNSFFERSIILGEKSTLYTQSMKKSCYFRIVNLL